MGKGMAYGGLKYLMYGLLFLKLSASLECIRQGILSAGVFQALQRILFAVFRAVDEPLASCVMVQF